MGEITNIFTGQTTSVRDDEAPTQTTSFEPQPTSESDPNKAVSSEQTPTPTSSSSKKRRRKQTTSFEPQPTSESDSQKAVSSLETPTPAEKVVMQTSTTKKNDFLERSIQQKMQSDASALSVNRVQFSETSAPQQNNLQLQSGEIQPTKKRSFKEKLQVFRDIGPGEFISGFAEQRIAERIGEDKDEKFFDRLANVGLETLNVAGETISVFPQPPKPAEIERRAELGLIGGLKEDVSIVKEVTPQIVEELRRDIPADESLRRLPAEALVQLLPELALLRGAKKGKVAAEISEIRRGFREVGDVPFKKPEVKTGTTLLFEEDNVLRVKQDFENINAPIEIRSPSSGNIIEFQTQLIEKSNVKVNPITGLPESTPTPEIDFSTGALLERQIPLEPRTQTLNLIESEAISKSYIKTFGVAKVEREITIVPTGVERTATTTFKTDFGSVDIPETPKFFPDDQTNIYEFAFGSETQPFKDSPAIILKQKKLNVLQSKRGQISIAPSELFEPEFLDFTRSKVRATEIETFKLTRQAITPSLETTILVPVPQTISVEENILSQAPKKKIKDALTIEQITIPIIEREAVSNLDRVQILNTDLRVQSDLAVLSQSQIADLAVQTKTKTKTKTKTRTLVDTQTAATQSQVSILDAITAQNIDLFQESKVQTRTITRSESEAQRRARRTVFPRPRIKKKRKLETRNGFFTVTVGAPGRKVFKTFSGLSLEEATFLGERTTLGTAAARVTIKGTTRELSLAEEEFVRRSLGKKFRKAKQAKKGEFIQKREFRIGTAGEKKEITLLGIQASKEKKKKTSKNKKMLNLVNKGFKLRDIKKLL